MDELLKKSAMRLASQKMDFCRRLLDTIDWNDRLIGILGARGTGKTTLMYQQMKRVKSNTLYISLDDLYFTANKLTDVAENFQSMGGEILFIDEVHKYPNWAREIKNIYDTYASLKMVFSGSSIIDILNQNVDLSRRAVQYELAGLSFREYLEFTKTYIHPVVSLSEILDNHIEIARDITGSIKPLQFFDSYLQNGYYPYFLENTNTYPMKVEQVVRLILESDMRHMEGFDPSNSRKMGQLLYILAANVPFKPDITKISKKAEINRITTLNYIHYLERARLLNLLKATGKSTSILQKPDKIYLENPNLHHVLAAQNVDKGSLREGFFYNQLVNAGHALSLPESGDFFVNEQFTFEIGGRNKPFHQLSYITNGYIAADDLEIGYGNKIPLWLFGFMY